MNSFKILNLTNIKYNFNLDRLNYLIEIAFQVQNKIKNINTEFVIYLVDNKKITELNFKTFGKNKPTDVLSFSYAPVFGEEKLKTFYLGEIFVNIQHENLLLKSSNIFYLMIIHGLLHLCGYDHDNQKTHNEMFFLQRNILSCDKYI
ncbi:rRNA maturation RNase YbeY [Mycoplasma sp. SG1]|uniref:rRNA maturation RNase YbeY n=1 Tax=Mycoplasma sp. SG1 TaxID=2810348 RepID=UPI002024C800|nr:rRNA maturation RNase YbeY [Mycoplasma sp. SG1]URM53147.1 rRNA maturation RNase YbeY [Mycoplasma sp. SG1]